MLTDDHAVSSAPGSRGKIFVATIGSLGDLFPFIALGMALRDRDYDVVLGVPASQLGAVAAAGLNAVAIMPPFDDICCQLGLAEPEVVRRIIDDQDFMIRRIAIPAMDYGVQAIEEASAGAVAIVASLFALAAPIVSEKRGIPFIPVFLQPMTIFSSFDPPIGQKFGTISTRRGDRLSRAWNRACFTVVRFEMRRRYARHIDHVRRANGLQRQVSTPILDHESRRILRLGLFPDVVAPPQPDFPQNFVHVGFPIFDGACSSTLDPGLEAFLAAGTPPLVFTLGSLVNAAPRNFYRESVALARLLGMRAVLLGGDVAASEVSDIFVADYVPHSLIFPRAAAIIHHGGIGTTGQALRAAKPQLIVPHLADQRDNGARLRRLGVGRVLDASRYSAGRAAPLVRALLADGGVRQHAEGLALRLQGENGAIAGARAIDLSLSGSRLPSRLRAV